MRENRLSARPLIVLQRALRYLFFIWFLIVTALSLTGNTVATELAFWGIIIVLVGTITRLLLTAELFRRSALYRHWLLSYILLVILLSTVILKY